MKKVFGKWQVIVAFISVLAIAGIVAVFSTARPSQPLSSVKKFNLTDTLLASYSQTTQSTAKLTYTQTGPVSITGTGVYNFTDNTGQINFTTQVNGQSIQSSWIFDGTVEYESTPQLPGKWLRVPLPNGNNFAPMSPFAFLNPAPARTILQRFAGNGVTEQRSTLAGTLATEYVGDVGLSQLSTSTPLPPLNKPLTIRLWVDSTGAARQIQTAFTLPSNSSAHVAGPQVSTIQFSNFGTPVNVSAPPSQDVVDQLPHYSGPPPQTPPTTVSGA